MPEEITSMDGLLPRKPLLAWVSYPYTSSNPFCFVYPQWVQSNREFIPINPRVLPDRGAIFVSIQGGEDAGGIRARYGEIVVATINADNIENRNYNGDDVENHYFARLNEHYLNSEIEFARLENHEFGRSLIQVVGLENEGISLLAPPDGPVGLLFDRASPITRWIMVERAEGSQLVYYGPLSAQQTATGEYVLDAVADFRKHIFKIDSSEVGEIVSVFRMHDDPGAAARFVERSVLNELQKYPKTSQIIDWVTDEELIDAIADVLKSAQDLPLSLEETKTAKKAIEKCDMSSSGLYLSEQRKARMEELLTEPFRWEGKIDVLAAALMRPETSSKLVELALSDAYFPRVKKLFVDSEAIQQQVESERQKHYAEAEKAKKATANALKAKAEADHQLKEGKARIEAMREEALSAIQGELGRAKTERDAVKSELKAAYEDLRVLDAQAQAVIEGFDTGVDGIMGNLLEHRVLRRLQEEAFQAEAPSRDEKLRRPRAALALRADEGEMSGQEVIEALHGSIAAHSSRDMVSEQVVNLLVCLMGSMITVLSGLPGVGKTSLAHVLAGSLGLTRPETPRFTKIPVERGWTGHRDYIGYYNPLTHRLEASNTAVFEEMLALADECRLAGTDSGTTESSIPYLMLLDEANLSVVENYWSPFLSNADNFLVQPTELSMQGGRLLRLPVNVRWLATVNYDHTTEALSDRFLNRAWVINIETDDLSLDDLSNSTDASDFSEVIPFSYGKLMEVFGPKEAAHIDDTGAKRLLTGFFAACKAQGRPVSYRCQRAIVRYVAAAEPLMRELNTSAGTCAVDFALAQRVLPSINGTGDETRKLLQDLMSTSPLLETTNVRIERMLQAGDADGFYQFFV